MNEGITELAWSGGKLADDGYDEFVFRANLTADLPAGDMIYFPAVQACGDATVERTQIPTEGQSAHDLHIRRQALSYSMEIT